MLILCGIARQTIEIDAALLEGVDPEARDARDFEGEVDLVLVGELVELGLVVEQRPQRAFGVLGGEHSASPGSADELAVDAKQRRRVHLQVQIRAVFARRARAARLRRRTCHLIGSPHAAP